MKLNKGFWFLIVLAFLGIMTSRAAYADSGSFFSITHSAPDFDLPTFDASKNFTKKDLNACASLVVFWASWCGTCHQEHSFLMELHDHNKIPIYGIDYADNSDDASAFLSNKGNPYKILAQDLDGQTANNFGINGVPESFLIDKKGKILYRHRGALTREAWENNILPLIQSC